MGNYIIFGGFGNPRRGGQARNLTTNVPKILYLKSSSEQIFSKNCRWVPLITAKAVTHPLLRTLITENARSKKSSNEQCLKKSC